MEVDESMQDLLKSIFSIHTKAVESSPSPSHLHTDTVRSVWSQISAFGRHLNNEPRDWHSSTLTTRPPRTSIFLQVICLPGRSICPTIPQSSVFSMLCLFLEFPVSVLHHPVHELLSRPSSSSLSFHPSFHYLPLYTVAS